MKRFAAVFAVTTVLDVLSWRALLAPWVPRESAVSRVTFQLDHADNVFPAPGPWAFTMLPQPVFPDARVLTVPPGYPVMLAMGEDKARHINVQVYEDRTPLMVLLEGTGIPGPVWLGVDGGGTPVVGPVGSSPPSYAQLRAVDACVDGAAWPAWTLVQGEGVEAAWGRCRWRVNARDARVTLSSPGSGMRVESDEPLAEGSIRPVLTAMVVLASIVSRIGLATSAWVSADVTATLVVLACSTSTRLWIVLWMLKGALGLVALALRVAARARVSRRVRGTLVLAAGMVAVVVAVVDPRSLAEANSAFNRSVAGARTDDETGPTPGQGTTHLVVGYSSVNGAALGRGAYGSAALDRQLQRACGSDRAFARHAVDGANGCFMAPTWNGLVASIPTLRGRVYHGGFNDDFSAPVSAAGAWLRFLVGHLPSREERPRFHEGWSAAAGANLGFDRVQEIGGCLANVARSSAAPLVHVYDLASFDLGRERRFGREAWVSPRRRTVEENGGTFLDLRTLLAGESPAYFDDFVHISEPGYRALVHGICAALTK